MEKPAENLRVRRNRVIAELVKGKEMAAQLQTLIRKPRGADEVSSVSELSLEICRSFTQAILELTCCGGNPQIYQIPAVSASSVDRKLEDSGESSGKKKGRRGRYKKSKNSDESWTKVSETMEDGGAWRKYGQKNIQYSEYPRCYFRCTHKHGQGCKAVKQVQKTRDGMYQTTYVGYHTCKDPRHQRLKFDVSEDAPTIPESSRQDGDGTVVTVKKEEAEAVQSDISESKSPENSKIITNTNNNNNYNHEDDTNDIWGDIMGQSCNYGDQVGANGSFYACSSTSFNDLDMETLFSFDQEM